MKKKTKDVWKLYVKSDECNMWKYEITEDSFLTARQKLREYRKNLPDNSSKIVRLKEGA